MIKTYHKNGAIERMNTLGSARTPFLFVIDFEMEKIIIEILSEINPAIKFNFNGFKKETSSTSVLNRPVDLQKFPPSFEHYADKFAQVIKEIQYGNSFLVNLTCASTILSDLSLEEIYSQAEAAYKIMIADNFVCYSPESFVKIKDNRISTYPMKGTISAEVENAPEILLNDPKENAEHCTIVDLLRNDLSMVAKNVALKKFKYLDKITTNQGSIYQMSSEIVGDLQVDFHERLGDLMFKLLPAGSICGAPKRQTTNIIETVENEPRGYYTGICGVFDGKNLDSGVMIRFIETNNGTLHYKSGGGITFQSDVKKEYQELVDKIYVPVSRKHKNLQRPSPQYQVSQSKM